MTLSSLVPEDQDKKLELIGQTKQALNGTLNPEAVKPSPSDEEMVRSMDAMVTALNLVTSRAQASQGHEQKPIPTRVSASSSPGVGAAQRLSSTLFKLSKANAALRAKANMVLTVPLKITLQNIRQSL